MIQTFLQLLLLQQQKTEIKFVTKFGFSTLSQISGSVIISAQFSYFPTSKPSFPEQRNKGSLIIRLEVQLQATIELAELSSKVLFSSHVSGGERKKNKGRITDPAFDFDDQN